MTERKNGHGDVTANGAAAVHPTLSAEQKELIREQLARILASPLFSHSKRFPDFLRYTVIHTLKEDTDSIKERTLGVDVFGRDANYDTSLDPVVRMTAVEIRKRLAQYYQLPNHEYEPRIDFARGSYVPEFRFPEQAPAAPATTATAADGNGTHAIANVAEDAKKPGAFLKKWRWVAAACVALPSLLVSGFFLNGTDQSLTEQFWGPLLSSKSPVLICLPDMNSMVASAAQNGLAPSAIMTAMEQMPPNFRRSKVTFGDVMALSEVTGMLGSKSKDFHVRHTEDVALEDLKDGPVVLIGGLSNQWAMQLGDGLRFSFAFDNGRAYVRDAQNPDSRAWADTKKPDGTETEDYALITRVLDPTTGRTAVTAAGIHHYGTQTAGECIINADCLAKAEKLAPGDWSKGNVQIVLGTSVISDNPGEPQVLAARIW
jgi:hypothetical protein